MLDEGEVAPKFELPNQDGELVALSDFEDQHVVVYFYPRANTEGCTKQAQSFRDAIEEFERRDVAVLGISDDPVADLQAFAEEYDLPFDLLSDEGGEVATLYDSYGEKQLFGNTFDGTFRNTYIVGPDGRIERALEGVDPVDHAQDILEELAAVNA